MNFTNQSFSIIPHEGIRTHGHGNRAFRVCPHGKARHAQECGFLLNPTRVRNDHGGASLKGEEIDVGQWIDEMQHLRVDAEFADVLARPRMNREHDIKSSVQLSEAVQNFAELFRVIHIRRPMQRHQRKRLRKAVLRSPSSRWQELHQRIDHHIPDQVHAFLMERLPA